MNQLYKSAIILVAISSITLILLWYILQQEGFETQTLNKFIKLQSFNNPNTFFNLTMLQNQVTNEDMDEYNSKGYWPWDQQTKDKYNEQLHKSTIQQEYPVGSYMAADQLLYNQSAINRILFWKSPEGQMAMNGVSVPNDAIKETINDEMGSFAIESGEIPKSEYYNSYVCNNGVMSKRIGSPYSAKYEPVSLEDLPGLIPGFNFTNGTCNPCGVFNNPDYKCAYTYSQS